MSQMGEMHAEMQDDMDNWSQADQEEAYYHFVLQEFAELTRQFGAHRVAVDLNKVRKQYKYPK